MKEGFDKIWASKRCFIIVLRIPDSGNLIKMFLNNLSDV